MASNRTAAEQYQSPPRAPRSCTHTPTHAQRGRTGVRRTIVLLAHGAIATLLSCKQQRRNSPDETAVVQQQTQEGRFFLSPTRRQHVPFWGSLVMDMGRGGGGQSVLSLGLLVARFSLHR